MHIRISVSTQLVCVIGVIIVPHRYNYPSLDNIRFFSDDYRLPCSYKYNRYIILDFLSSAQISLFEDLMISSSWWPSWGLAEISYTVP